MAITKQPRFKIERLEERIAPSACHTGGGGSGGSKGGSGGHKGGSGGSKGGNCPPCHVTKGGCC